MPAVTLEREKLSRMIDSLSDENVLTALDYVSSFLPDEEPPLNEDELEGLRSADRDIAEGRVRSFAEAIKDLW